MVLFVENVTLLRTSTQLGMYIQNDEHFKNIIMTLLFKINGFESTYRVVNFSKQTFTGRLSKMCAVETS